MPALLYGIGAFALFAGLVMIGFGVPINEFSFGNTLIGAGTTAAIGGLIIIGLGAVAGQLRRLAETLALQSTGRFAPTDVETAGAHRPIPAQAAGRAAHPARPKTDVHADGAGFAQGAGMPFEDRDESFAPTLRNPDEVTGHRGGRCFAFAAPSGDAVRTDSRARPRNQSRNHVRLAIPPGAAALSTAAGAAHPHRQFRCNVAGAGEAAQGSW